MNRIGKRIFVFLTAVLLLMSLVSLPVLAADTADVERIYGENRCLTAIEVSQFAYPDGADTVIIVTANNFPDALAGSVLAHHLGAPILLVRDNDSDMTAVLAEMERLGVETAYILGGDKAVSDALEAKIETKASVERLAGESRYETAQLIADMVGMPEDGHVFLVSGTNFPDALAIAPVAARRGIPILLTDPDYLRDDVLTAFDELDVKSVTIIGGPKAIPEELAALLEEKGLEIEERIYGDSREDTAVAIAIAFFTEPGSVIVANGREGYPDALVGGYLGALLNAPLLLVKKDEVKDSTTTYLEDNNIGDVKVLGGDKVISDEVEEALGEIEGGEETPGGGGPVVPTDPEADVSAISVDKDELTLTVGATETLTVTVTVTPDTEANRAVTWTSNKPSVATVDAKGKITAVGVGEAVITVTSVKDAKKTATVAVTVKDAPVEKEMIVTPATGAEIAEDGTITVTAEGANELRIMLWAKELADTDAAIAAYSEKVFSARTGDLVTGGMAIANENGTFTITINEALIAMLEAGTKFDGDQSSTGNYTWKAGDKTTWLITPETGGELWEEYATWDGSKVEDSLFVYTLGTEEIEVPVEKEMTVTPATGTIELGKTITVTAPEADELRIMLWAKELADTDAAIAAYSEKVFSARTGDLVTGGMAIANENDTFTITINEALIAMLEAGTKFDGDQSSTGNYTWKAGDKTTWLITPETDGVLWEEYATWDGSKVNEALFVYTLGEAVEEKEMTVAPEKESVILKDGKITVTADGADDLRIMLWAEELDTVQAAKDKYYDDSRVFSARLSTIAQAEGINATLEDGTFTLTINEALINLLEAGTRFEDGVAEDGSKYDWSAGDATTWLITPETEGKLWEEYATWDGAKVEQSLFVYTLGEAEDETKTTVTTTEGLESALANEVVTEITIDGTLGSESAYTVYNVNKTVTIQGAEGSKVFGTFIVKADGVTIKDLAIQNKGDLTGESSTNRGGIYVFANNVTLTNNTITNGLGENAGLSNAIQIMSSTENNSLSNYVVTGNKLIGHDNEVTNWSSSGIVIAQNYTPGSIGEPVLAITATLENYQSLLTNNTFTNNKIDLQHQDWTTGLEGGPVIYPYAITGLTITGDAEVGKTLTANIQPTEATVSYQWQVKENADWTDIAGATESTYELTAAYVGKDIRVIADGTVHYATWWWTSGSVQVVKADGPEAPINLVGISPPSNDLGAGKITGTTADMEWKVTPSENNYNSCSDGETIVGPSGTYLVRYKETDTTKFGADAEITVPDKNPPIVSVVSAARNSETEATIKFKSSEDGPYYIAVVNHGGPEPTIDTSGVGSLWTEDDFDQYTYVITVAVTLPGGTEAKDVYFVVKDASGNESSLKFEVGEYVEPWASPEDTDFEFNATDGAIIGYTGTATDIIIPAYFNVGGENIPVTTIGADAFGNPDTTYPEYTSVFIPNTVTTISQRNFQGCTSLTSITLEEGITTLSANAFEGCTSLNNVVLPASLTNVGGSAFKNCTSLSNLTINGNVASSGTSGPFNGCSALETVTFGSSVTEIGQYLFANTTFTTFTIPGTVTTLGLSSFYNSKVTTITIPTTVDTIGGSAFMMSSDLATVVIPSGANVGAGAFAWCNSLGSITIGSSVTIEPKPNDYSNAAFDEQFITLYQGENGGEGFYIKTDGTWIKQQEQEEH